MPYKIDLSGIYKIVNHATGECYVGKSKRVQKRIREHFRLLNLGTHPNKKLQAAFFTYGEAAFSGELEILCADPAELVLLEESFLQGRATFLEPATYNISSTSHAPMVGRTHSEEVRERIRLGRRAATFDYQSEEYRHTLSTAQMARYQEDPKFVAKLKFILDNDHMSYAERARQLGSDTSSVRRLYLKHQHRKGTF